MSVAPRKASATIDSQVMVDRPNSTVKAPNSATKPSMIIAGMVADRMSGQPDGDADGADAGRRAQQAETPGAEFENVARIDRQQRRGAGQKHGEQIERDGAEHDLLAPDVAEAGEQGLHRRLVGLAALDGLRDGEDQQAGHKHQHGGGAVCRFAPKAP